MRKLTSSSLALAVCLLGVAARTDAAPITLGTDAGFVLLALNGGSLDINSATSITGNVGYSANVAVPNAQKVDSLHGSVDVHSGATTTNFNAKYVPATFAPTGRIHYGPGPVDTLLDQANTDAQALKTNLDSLFAGTATNLGTLSSNLSLTGSGGTNLYNVNWSLNSNTITLNGSASDWFVFRSTGFGNTWAQSSLVLDGGVDPNHVLFYFSAVGTGIDAMKVNKSSTNFVGTIFAPNAMVEYHNPAKFDGRIIANSIDVHSDFNITAPPPPQVPEPATVVLTALGVALAAAGGRRRG